MGLTAEGQAAAPPSSTAPTACAPDLPAAASTHIICFTESATLELPGGSNTRCGLIEGIGVVTLPVMAAHAHQARCELRRLTGGGRQKHGLLCDRHGS